MSSRGGRRGGEGGGGGGEQHWNMFGKKSPKSAAVFFAQIIVIYIVVITSIINLSILDCTRPGVCNLWIAMLSSALGYLLPNPSLRIRRAAEGAGPAATDNASAIGLALLDNVDGTTTATSATPRNRPPPSSARVSKRSESSSSYDATSTNGYHTPPVARGKEGDMADGYMPNDTPLLRRSIKPDPSIDASSV